MSEIVTASGYGLSVSVKRGHLVVEDGVGTHRRKRRFNRAVPKLERLVVHGHSGTVSLDALRWLRDVGASFLQIDHDGAIVSASTPGHQAIPRIVISQVEARANGRALHVMRRLISQKIEGQIRNLRYMGADPRLTDFVTGHLQSARGAESFDELRAAEGPAGKQYWRAWEGLAVKFDDQELQKIPKHWARFNRRRSAISEGNRNAIDPPNAALNYLFTILEAEVQLHAMQLGLNPYIGLMHSDQRFRATLALDLMEPLRPYAEMQVLRLFGERTFRAEEFFETREGACRLVPPLTNQVTHALFAEMPDVRRLVKGVRTRLLVGAAQRT